jgi:O-antigen/teichoic acid export membrane protein
VTGAGCPTGPAISAPEAPALACAAEFPSLSDPTSLAHAPTIDRPRVDARVFVRGIAALMVSQGFTWFSAAVITFTMPRYLGSANLGLYSFAVAVFGLAELTADLGIGTYVNRQVARSPASAPRLVTAALASRFALGLAAAAVLGASFHVLSRDPVLTLTIDVLCVNVLVDSFAMIGSTLNGLFQIKWIAAAQAVNKLVVAALVVVALRAGYGAPGVAVASLGGAVVSHVINGGALLRIVRPALQVDLRLCRELIVGGLPFFVMSAALVVYSQIDTVMLAGLTTPSTVGWYNAALRIIAIPGFVPVIVMAVTFPALSGAARDKERFAGIAHRSIQVILLATVPIGVGMVLLPDRLTEFFRYPSDFSHSWPLIVLLALGMPLIGVDMVIGAALVASDRQWAWTRVGIAAAILNPLVNFAAIPYTAWRFGNGAVGAAAVTSLTELFMLVMGVRLLPPGTLGRSTLIAAARVLVTCLPLAGVAWLTRGQHILVPVLLGAVVYSACCLLTRTVTIADLREVLAHLARRREAAA